MKPPLAKYEMFHAKRIYRKEQRQLKLAFKKFQKEVREKLGAIDFSNIETWPCPCPSCTARRNGQQQETLH